VSVSCKRAGDLLRLAACCFVAFSDFPANGLQAFCYGVVRAGYSSWILRTCGENASTRVLSDYLSVVTIALFVLFRSLFLDSGLETVLLS